MSLSFIDPAVFIWDVQDFTNNPHKYSLLAEEIIALLAMISKSEIHIAGNPEFFENLVNSFPYSGINAKRAGLSDFTTLVYKFFDDSINRIGHSNNSNVASSNPDLSNRAHFNPNLKHEINYALYSLSTTSHQNSIFSHVSLHSNPIRSIDIVVSPNNTCTVQCFADLAAYNNFFIPPRKIYEHHWKHDSLSGYGSKLPDCLDYNNLQDLLDNAVNLNEKFMCIFSSKANEYIVFRSHVPNRYHAYPIQSNKLSRSGINPSDIPTL